MFIDTAMNPKTRGPEERNVAGNDYPRPPTFRSSGAGKVFRSLRSRYIRSLRADVPRKTLPGRQEIEGVFRSVHIKGIAQLAVVVLSAAAVKQYYSTASVNQLRWILAPTTVIVELVTGSRFEFESHAGYLSSDRSFLIAASCAGVNFLITSFLMLSLGKLWKHRSVNLSWSFIPGAVLFAYLTTIVANSVRIAIALRLHQTPLKISWLNPGQIHRFEGIIIYFGFLLLLFVISEKLGDRLRSLSSENSAGPGRRFGLFRRYLFPLLVYYAIALGIPLVNGAYHERAEFLEHALFVLVTPLLLVLPIVMFYSAKGEKYESQEQSEASPLDSSIGLPSPERAE